MSIATTTLRDYAQGNKSQYQGDLGYIRAYGYNPYTNLCNNLTYFSSGALQLTVVGTGTRSVVSTAPSAQAKSNGNFFYPSNTTPFNPLRGNNSPTFSLRVVAAAANDGIKLTFATPVDISGDEFASMVVATGTASAAFSIKIRSSTSNESVFTSTGSSVANTFTRSTWRPVNVPTNTLVTLTGSPVFTAVTAVEITLAAAGYIDLYSFLTAQDQFLIPGEQVRFSFGCIAALEAQRNLDTAEVTCGNAVADLVALKNAPKISITTDEQNFFLTALCTDTLPKNRLTAVATKAGSFVVSGTGTVALGSGVKEIAKVKANGINLGPTIDGLPTDKTYKFDSTTGTLTFATDTNNNFIGYSNLLAPNDPKYMEIEYFDFQFKPVYDLKQNSLGFRFWFDTKSGVKGTQYVALLTLESIGAKDGNDQPKYNLQALQYNGIIQTEISYQ